MTTRSVRQSGFSTPRRSGKLGLPEEHAANHTVVFLRWLIERNLMSEEFLVDRGRLIEKLNAGQAGSGSTTFGDNYVRDMNDVVWRGE